MQEALGGVMSQVLEAFLPRQVLMFHSMPFLDG